MQKPNELPFGTPVLRSPHPSLCQGLCLSHTWKHGARELVFFLWGTGLQAPLSPQVWFQYFEEEFQQSLCPGPLPLTLTLDIIPVERSSKCCLPRDMCYPCLSAFDNIACIFLVISA